MLEYHIFSVWVKEHLMDEVNHTWGNLNAITVPKMTVHCTDVYLVKSSSGNVGWAIGRDLSKWALQFIGVDNLITEITITEKTHYGDNVSVSRKGAEENSDGLVSVILGTESIVKIYDT